MLNVRKSLRRSASIALLISFIILVWACTLDLDCVLMGCDHLDEPDSVCHMEKSIALDYSGTYAPTLTTHDMLPYDPISDETPRGNLSRHIIEKNSHYDCNYLLPFYLRAPPRFS